MPMTTGGVVNLMKEGYALIQTPKGLYKLNREEKWYSIRKDVFEWLQSKTVIEQSGTYPDGGIAFRLRNVSGMSVDQFRTGLFIRLGRALKSVQASEITVTTGNLRAQQDFNFRGKSVTITDQLLSDPVAANVAADQVVEYFLGIRNTI